MCVKCPDVVILVSIFVKIPWDVYVEYGFSFIYFRGGSTFISSSSSEVCKMYTVLVVLVC